MSVLKNEVLLSSFLSFALPPPFSFQFRSGQQLVCFFKPKSSSTEKAKFLICIILQLMVTLVVRLI